MLKSPASLRLLLLFLPAFCRAQTVTLDPSAGYSTNDWPVEGLGNSRARVSVAEKSPAVWAHIPWRRRDSRPEAKDIIIVEAGTQQRVKNVIRLNVNAEFGDLLFEPPSAPAAYFIYYLPYKMEGDWWFPTTRYLTPTNLADPAWVASCEPLVQRFQRGDTNAIPQARLLQIEAINDFHRFDPMEVPATTNELRQLTAEQASRPYLVFPEDRTRPIRMTDELPLRWIQSGPSDSFQGQACRGEFYAFQFGVYASQQPLEDVKVEFSDLVGSDGAVIPAAALRCFNTGGTNWLGRPLTKTINIPSNKVQAFWCGVMIPKDATPQAYLGTATIRPKNLPATPVALRLAVSSQILADAGDGDLWRQSRLRWLDSTIGLDDEAFAPYTPVQLQGRTVSVLGRAARFNDTGLLDSIVSHFTPEVDATNGPARELLAAPMRFVVETAQGPLDWTGGRPRLLSRSSGVIVWESRSSAGPLEMLCRAKMECDGYINFKLTLKARQRADLKDLRLEIPLRRQTATYMTGLGAPGGYRPKQWDWHWDVAQPNNQFWIGEVNAGLNCKLKDIEDRWDQSNLRASGPYRDWDNGGKGGCALREEGDRVTMRAFSGPRSLAAGEELHFNFGLLITPVKPLDRGHWDWRYFHRGVAKPVADVAKTGAKIINLHQGDAYNPYINYPFLTVDKMKAYVSEAHARNMKVKIYYTIRELSDYTAEFWALRSLGDEVFKDGPGYGPDEWAQVKDPPPWGPPRGSSWLCEHVLTGYLPAWHQPLGNGRMDAAIITQPLSRWHNYYLEGLRWLMQNVGIDGLYLDGIGYDREVMKRVRKVMQRSRSGCLIDFHGSKGYHPPEYLNSTVTANLELLPCIDSLWFGEGFEYDEPPDFWLVEISGLPFGLYGEMLSHGGNPWRGMLYGMTARLGWGGDPVAVWKVWDDFGIQQAKMLGYWNPACPVQTGRKDILATAYVRPGRTLVSVASWATNDVPVTLRINYQALGLDPAKTHLYAPSVAGFQEERLFQPADAVPVAPGRGWLLFLDEEKRQAPNPKALEQGRATLLEEKFQASALPKEWSLRLSDQPGTTLRPAGGELQITADANVIAFAQRPLPPGAGLISCLVVQRGDGGASWGPGLALLWPGQKMLRVNIRSDGTYEGDVGAGRFLGGYRDTNKWSRLLIRLEEKDVIVMASQDRGFPMELARAPRSEFPGDPIAIRLGKIGPASNAEDYSTPGPNGASAIQDLLVLGKNSE